MSERIPSGSSRHSDYYDRAADAVPQFTVLNYGFSSEPENSVIAANEPEFYCLRLYEHTLRDTPVEGRDVLEVSCGRGGGANFVSRTFKPQRYVGVDLEPGERSAGTRACRSPGSHVRDRQRRAARSARCLVRRCHQHRSLALVRESRPVLRGSAARAQTGRPFLLHRRLLGRRRLHGGPARRAGFELLERLEITSNVLHALRKDNARRTALFDAMKNRDLREEYKHWGGVVGYRAYNRFEAGQTRYFSHRLRRPG